MGGSTFSALDGLEEDQEVNACVAILKQQIQAIPGLDTRKGASLAHEAFIKKPMTSSHKQTEEKGPNIPKFGNPKKKAVADTKRRYNRTCIGLVSPPRSPRTSLTQAIQKGMATATGSLSRLQFW